MVLYIHVEDGDKIGTGLTHPHTLYHTNPLIAVMMLMIFMDMMMVMIFMDMMIGHDDCADDHPGHGEANEDEDDLEKMNPVFPNSTFFAFCLQFHRINWVMFVYSCRWCR